MRHLEAFDVAVVGGGTAGVAAALGASRLGARTLLVEESDALGGNAANAQVHTICGLYFASEREGSAAPEMAHPGFPREFSEGLARAGAAGLASWAGRVAVLPTEPARLAHHADRICSDAKDLSVWKSCTLVSAELPEDGSGESELAVREKGERLEVSARVVIDTSGDGAVAHRADADWGISEPDELQAASYIFVVSGVDPAPLEGLGRLKVSHAVAGAVRLGHLSPGCESVSLRPGLRPGDFYLTLNVPKLRGCPFAPLDDSYRRKLEENALDASRELERFLTTTRPEFKDAHISTLPRRVGIRETRRVRGIQEISADDVLCGRRPDDEVALSVWPIEIWRDHRRAHFQYPKGPSGIPLGALISRSHANLGMAGRCLSASHEALGALRVIGTALATGEAIGVAAALAADGGTPLASVSPSEVRRHVLRLAEGDRRR